MKRNIQVGSNVIKNLPLMLFLVILVASISPITFGIYYSCLPQICSLFEQHDIFYPQLAFITYMAGFLVFQLIYGPLSDFYERKPIILIGMGIFIIGSLLNILFHSLFAFVLSPLLQGLGAVHCIPLSIALQKDIYKGNQYYTFGSYVAMGLSLTAMCSPIIGSLIQKLSPETFTANVGFIALYGLLIFMVILKY